MQKLGPLFNANVSAKNYSKERQVIEIEAEKKKKKEITVASQVRFFLP